MEINCSLIGLWRIQENNSNSNFDVDADRDAGFILKCYVMMPHGAHASFKILKLVYRIVFGDMFSNVNIHLFSTFPSFYSPGVHNVPILYLLASSPSHFGLFQRLSFSSPPFLVFQPTVSLILITASPSPLKGNLHPNSSLHLELMRNVREGWEFLSCQEWIVRSRDENTPRQR